MIEQAKIKRVADHVVEIEWIGEEPNQVVSIFCGDSPESIDHQAPLVAVKSKNRIQVAVPENRKRLYYKLKPDHGKSLIIAERRVHMEGAVNFRDLGGYRTGDGRSVKWGRVFRSDNLSRLTAKDLIFLKTLNLRLVCDLRTKNETKTAPDRLPDGEIEYLNLPVDHDSFDFQVGLKKMKEGDDSWLTDEFMIKGYIRNIEEFPGVWGTLFTKSTHSANLPLLFHCTGGKDRAGTCAALILLTLGVPEETVIYDHQLSNVYIADIMDKVNARVRSYGLDPEKLKPYFSAPREAIIALLDYINNRYGSARNYLTRKAGIDDKVIADLKEELLD